MSEPTIFSALAAVMGDVQAIGKDGRNERDGYAFRGIDSTMNAVGPALRQHGVIVVPTVLDARYEAIEIGRNRTVMRECTVRVKFTFYGPAGDSIECVTAGEAMDVADKSASKAQSVAMRVALLQALCVPTGDEDPDTKTHRRAPRQDQRQADQDHGPDRGYSAVDPAKIRRRMDALFTRAGIGSDREARLRFASAVIGRQIDSSNELTPAEVGLVIKALEQGIAEPHEEQP
jgi:hypothetical protein